MPGSWSDYLELRTGDAPPPSPEGGDVRVYADGSGDLRAIQSDGTDAPVGGGGSPFNGGTITTPLEINSGDGTLGETNFTVTNSIDTTLCEIDDDGGVTFDTPAGSAKFTVKHNGTLGLRVSNGTVNLRGDGGIFLVSGGVGIDVNPDGMVVTGANAEPASGELIAGSFALWLDATNGAAKLMVKAKQADGTVVSGELPLT